MTTIALALGAGGARGLAHIHVLRALDDLGVKPIAIAGTSIGAVLGASYSAGMSGGDIQDFVAERFRDRLRLMRDIAKAWPKTMSRFMADGGPRLGELNLERIFDVILPGQIPASFEDLAIPVQVIATDYYGQCDHVFESGPLRPALAASAAMPGVFLPVVVDGRFYIDGGSTNPLPFDRLQGKADIIVAIDVSGGPCGDPTRRPRKIDVMYAASQLMQRSIVRAKTASCRVDVLLRPKVDRFRVLDFLKTQAVLDETAGFREEVKSVLGEILSRA